jgi:hypothetical protein
MVECSGNITDLSFKQAANALSPIVVTELGIIMA